MTTTIRLVVVLFAILNLPALAETVAWEHDGRGEDGQPVTLTQFRLYCYPVGTARPATPSATAAGTARTLSYAMPSGDLTCVMIAVANAKESLPSNEVRVRAVSPTVPADMRCAADIAMPTYIVAPNGTYTTRPLYDRPGGIKIGSVEIRRPDGAARPCENGAALLVTTSGEWRYVTNNAGLRGAALCKRQ